MLILLPVSGIVSSGKNTEPHRKAWISGFALFGYAAAFSLGYVTITAGTGTLILVGAVQVTMLGWALFKKDPVHPMKWIGSAVSMGGLIYLVSPGLTAPDPIGAGLMLIAGTAWGIYSIRGRGAQMPIQMTTRNFIYAMPPTLLMLLLSFQSLEISEKGAMIAICSGAITSGLGYILWYRALRHLSTSSASIVQLVIPVLAALGGVLFLDESITSRLVASSVLILGGVLIGLGRRKRSAPRPAAAANEDAHN